MSLNRVFIGGRLVRDPELRVTSSGMSLCRFSVAVDDTRKKKGGEIEKRTHFFDVTAFGRSAEMVSKHFGKGDYLLFEGKLQQEHWETADGGKRSRVSMILDVLHFTGGRGGQGGGAGRDAAGGGGADDGGADSGDDSLDEDVPF